MLSTTCDPIVNKPKLKIELPKDETKQDGDKKEDGKDDENTGQQPAAEQEDTTHNTSAMAKKILTVENFDESGLGKV